MTAWLIKMVILTSLQGTSLVFILQYCLRCHHYMVFQIEEESKRLLLQCADPEAIMRLALMNNSKTIVNQYFNNHSQSSITDFLYHQIVSNQPTESVFVQVRFSDWPTCLSF